MEPTVVEASTELGTAGARSGVTVVEVVVVAALCALAEVGFVALARAHGALGVARNDDWAYYRVVFDYSRTGRLRLVNWGQMTLVGQIFLGAAVMAVVGRSMTTLQVMVAVMGAVAVTATYILLRTFLSRVWSGFCCALLVVGPLFGTLSVSYMTDVPAYCLETLTLLVGWRAVSRRRVSIGWLVASAVLGLAAVSIRDNGAFAFGAVLLVALGRTWTHQDQRGLRATLGVTAGFTVAGLVLLQWAHGLPHAEQTTFGIHLFFADHVPRTVLSLALFILPCLVLVSPRRLWGAIRRLPPPLQVVFAVGSLGLLALSTGTFVGTYFGSSPVARGDPASFIPPILYLLLRLGACYGLVVLVGLLVLAIQAGLDRVGPGGWRQAVDLVADARSATALLTLFLVVNATAQVLTMPILNIPIFDRYLLGFIPFVAGLVVVLAQVQGLLVRPTRSTVVLAVVGLAALLLVGLQTVDATDATDAATWALGRKAVAIGYRADQVDGGFEWFSYHQPGPVTVPQKAKAKWYLMQSPRPTICATTELRPEQDPGGHSRVLATERATTLFGQHLDFVLRPGPDHCAGPQR